MFRGTECYSQDVSFDVDEDKGNATHNKQTLQRNLLYVEIGSSRTSRLLVVIVMMCANTLIWKDTNRNRGVSLRASGPVYDWRG